MDEQYWKDLNNFPPMSRKEEKETAIKAKAGDRKAYEKLINSNLRFVVSVAKEYNRQGMTLEELVAYGNLGLCKAYAKFDPERNMKFITYAVWWIRQAILQALSEYNHLIRIPHYQRVTKTLLEKTKEKLEREKQRQVSNEEVEDEIGKKLKISTIEAYYVIPLEKSFSYDGNTPIKHIIKDEKAEDPEAVTNHESFISELDDILSEFSDREKTIIKYYHGIGVIRNLTLEEIGAEFGITRERVRQIKVKILEKLRHKSRRGRLQPYLAILKSEIFNDILRPESDTN